MRCSVCQHLFEYTIEQELSLDQEFDMLVSSTVAPEPQPSPSPPSTETDEPLEETLGHEPGADLTLAETSGQEPGVEAPAGDSPVHHSTESVMREIDSILGSAEQGEEVAGGEIVEEAPKRRGRVLKIAAAVAGMVAIAVALVWVFSERGVFFTKPAEKPKATAEHGTGPFFVIDEKSLTHELLTHEQEGSVLVIRGTLKQLTSTPVESVTVEARVFDNAGNLMESRIAYAGIVPDMSEFARQPRADIDALLTADPATPGSTLPTGDIPFAVAFFGKAASEGVSYRVEVKEIRWK